MIEIGTTPTHIFDGIPPEICPLIKEVKITYLQNNEEVLVKRTEDCTIGEGQISTKLTQEDTFRFDWSKLVSIQLRVLTTNGECFKSDPMMEAAGRCLDKEVLS